MGLTAVESRHLEHLLRAIHRQEIRCPLDLAELALIGLQDISHHLLGHLRGLDRKGVHAVLVAVLAERREGTPASRR
jgi:hypothetical protein